MMLFMQIVLIVIGLAAASIAMASDVITVFGINAAMSVAEREKVVVSKGFECRETFNGTARFCAGKLTDEVRPAFYKDFIQIFPKYTVLGCGVYSSCKFTAWDTASNLIQLGRVKAMFPSEHRSCDIAFSTVGPAGDKLTVGCGRGRQRIELERHRLGDNNFDL